MRKKTEMIDEKEEGRNFFAELVWIDSRKKKSSHVNLNYLIERIRT